MLCMATQKVDIYLGSFCFLAKYQPFVSSFYIFTNTIGQEQGAQLRSCTRTFKFKLKCLSLLRLSGDSTGVTWQKSVLKQTRCLRTTCLLVSLRVQMQWSRTKGPTVARPSTVKEHVLLDLQDVVSQVSWTEIAWFINESPSTVATDQGPLRTRKLK